MTFLVQIVKPQGVPAKGPQADKLKVEHCQSSELLYMKKTPNFKGAVWVQYKGR